MRIVGYHEEYLIVLGQRLRLTFPGLGPSIRWDDKMF